MKYSYNIINKLISKKITIATVESCSGGLLAYSFIKKKGISKIFKVGLITYSNESKIKLGVSKNEISKYGVVSPEIAKSMINNLYKNTKCDLIISTTGITGPDGGTKKKPVGLVYMGIKYKRKNYIFKKKFRGNRNKIQRDTVNYIFSKIKKLI